MQHGESWQMLRILRHLKLLSGQSFVSRGEGNGRRRSRVRLNEGQGDLLATGWLKHEHHSIITCRKLVAFMECTEPFSVAPWMLGCLCFSACSENQEIGRRNAYLNSVTWRTRSRRWKEKGRLDCGNFKSKPHRLVRLKLTAQGAATSSGWILKKYKLKIDCNSKSTDSILVCNP